MLDSGNSERASEAHAEQNADGERTEPSGAGFESPTSGGSARTTAGGIAAEPTLPRNETLAATEGQMIALRRHTEPGNSADRTSQPSETLAATDEQMIALRRHLEPANPPREADQLQVGHPFGGFTLIRKLASGGMGVVYLARQESLRRSVALKMILAGDHASDEEIQRFRHEAEAVAQLDHPGIVPIFEVGENLGLHYFSMAFVGGGTLSDRLKDGPLPPRKAVELVRQIAEAVGYAHQRGIIHRDLKPGNILLDEEGHPKVTDFGLAKNVSGLSQLTVTGQVMGTPSYMAPEQAAGRTGEVGPASDLYSLGAVLYCLVTGRPPFQAATPVETLRQVMDQEPVSPRQLNGSVGRDLETVCLKCLQKEPSKRYAAAAALAEDLRRILAGEPILARPVGTVERLWRWCRRNRVVAALGLLTLLSLLGGIMVSSFYATQAQRDAAKARRAQALSDRRWYAAELGLARQDWEKGRTATALRRLESLGTVRPGAPDLRGFEWHYLNRLCHLDLRTLRGSGEPARSVAFSPDGQHLATAGGVRKDGQPGTIRLWDSASGRLIHTRIGHTGSANCVAFSPDGTRIASAGAGGDQPGEVKLWDSAGVRQLMSLSGQTMPVRNVAFSPDSRRLAGAAGGYDAVGRSLPGEVLVWDLDKGPLILRLRGHKCAVLGVAFSPDGRWLASADSFGAVKVWDSTRGDEITELRPLDEPVSSTVECLAFSPNPNVRLLATGSQDRSIRVWDASRWDTREAAPQKPLFTLRHPSPAHGIAFSPNGRLLAAAYDDHTVRTWNLATRTISLTLRGHVNAVSGVAFSPDGWRLASASQDETIKVWDATGERGTIPLRDRHWETGQVQALAFSPDGRWLASASADRAVRIWDVSTGLVVRTCRGHADAVSGVAFSPDGQWLATAGEDRAVIIWDRASGERRRTITGLPEAVHGVAFSPDGRWLACAIGGWKKGGTIQLTSLSRDGEVISLTDGPDHVAQAGFHKVAFSPDSRSLAAGCDDATIRVWDLDAMGPSRVLRGHSDRIMDVAFSPNGRWIASASADNTAKLWNATTGATIATLNGHTAYVGCVAFSLDGRRLASAGWDYAVKLWDPRTLEEDPRAQEIDSLGVPWAGVRVAFHPDGRRLAVGGAFAPGSDLGLDHSLAIWDARDPETEPNDQDEARSRVAFLFDRHRTAEEVRERLRHDASLAEPARERALDLVDAFERERARQEAEDCIARLAGEGLLQSEILERLRNDPDLSAPVRKEALDLARSPVEGAVWLDMASRSVAGRQGGSASAYQRALKQAETACRLAPHRRAFQVTLGMAQYRLANYTEALEILTRADTSGFARDAGSEAPRLAFLAMAEHRLDRRDRAAAALEKYRDVLRRTARSGGEEAIALRREVEQLIEPGSVPRPSTAQDRR